MSADRPDPRANGTRPLRSHGHPATPPVDPGCRLAGPVSTLDRVTLQLGVAVAVLIALCSLSVSGVARQRDLLVLRCRLGVVDRAGVKVERPERHEDDDLDAGEGHHRMKERRGLGSPSGITSRCGLKLNWRAGIVARGRPALSRCSDLVRRHDG